MCTRTNYHVSTISCKVCCAVSQWETISIRAATLCSHSNTLTACRTCQLTCCSVKCVSTSNVIIRCYLNLCQLTILYTCIVCKRLEYEDSCLVIETEVKYAITTCCICCTTVTCLTNMCGAIRLCLTLCCRDSYVIVKTILTRVIYLISCAVSVLTRNHKLKAGSLLCWSIATLVPSSVIILYIDMITSLPEESTVVIVE